MLKLAQDIWNAEGRNPTMAEKLAACRREHPQATADEIKPFIIPGGRITKSRMKKVLNFKTIDEVVKYGRRIKLHDVLEKYKQDNSLLHFELDLEKILVTQSLKSFRRSVLSLGTIVSFLYLKEEEINNIRKIVRSKENGIPKEKVKQMLVAA